MLYRHAYTQFAAILVVVGCFTASAQDSAPVGIFESHGDVGETPKKGAAEFNAATADYRITGGGANIWAATDAFQFAWKRMAGDITISADVHFEGESAAMHRKAVLMVRQSLDPDSAYADLALHGDGLTSLQFRPTAGALTQELRSPVKGPLHVRIEKRGNQFTIFVNKPGEEPTSSGPVAVELHDPVYVGIGVCSHVADNLETADFSNLKIEGHGLRVEQQRPRFRSHISIFNLRDKTTKVLYTADETFEAPNWSPDGKYLITNSGGKLYRIPVDGDSPKPEVLPTGPDVSVNNDHSPSPDGKLLAISGSLAGKRGSQVFVLNMDGSNRRQMTTQAPSYFHGWSQDGKFLAVVAQRNDNFDLYRIPVGGVGEERLTTSPAYDDGPDYSPDGKWIYFNSNRSGGWDIWRMPPEGAGPNDSKAERITRDDLEDWFPHPSPDGKWLVFLSFPKGTENHNGKANVQLRMIPLPHSKIPLSSKIKKAGDAPIQVLTTVFGGQGTINVNSWAPDSARFAFVSYEPLK